MKIHSPGCDDRLATNAMASGWYRVPSILKLARTQLLSYDQMYDMLYTFFRPI